MSDFLVDPPRWKDRTDQTWLAERTAGQVIRSRDQPEPFSPSQLACISARIRSEHRTPRHRRFWLTATAGLLFCGATAAFAAHMNVLPRWLTDMVKPQPADGPSLRPAPSRKGAPLPVRAPAAKLLPEPSTNKPAPAEPPTFAAPPAVPRGPAKTVAPAQTRAKPHRTAARPLETKPIEQPAVRGSPPSPPQAAPVPAALDKPVAPPSSADQAPVRQLAWVDRPSEVKRPQPLPVAPAKESSPSEDTGENPARHLTEAIRALRVDHSPDTALALLNRHAPTLDKSSLRHEALLLRVEAMLKLNQKPEVLRLLESTPLSGVAASRTLLLTRAELRAAAGHCAESLADFDRVLAQAQGHDARALLGRAQCRKQLGDEPGAREDLQRYRREFPSAATRNE